MLRTAGPNTHGGLYGRHCYMSSSWIRGYWILLERTPRPWTHPSPRERAHIDHERKINHVTSE